MVSLINSLESTYIGVAPKIKLYYQRDFIESVGIFIENSLNIGHYGMGQLDLSQYNRNEDIFGTIFCIRPHKKKSFS